MKASAAPVLGVLLGISVLFNIVAFGRPVEKEPPRPASIRPSPRGEVAAASPVSRPSEEAVPVARPADPAVAAPAPAAKAAVPSSSIAAVRNDPEVLGVLDAQAAFSTFWRDLDRVFKARSKVDEAKYFQTVTTAVGDFLGLPESSRPGFSEAVRAGAVAMAEARKMHDAGRQALPPRDKADPASVAVYQQQKDAVDLRYKEQTKRVVDGVKSHLDPAQPRHVELASNLDRLLRNLAPRQP